MGLPTLTKDLSAYPSRFSPPSLSFHVFHFPFFFSRRIYAKLLSLSLRPPFAILAPRALAFPVLFFLKFTVCRFENFAKGSLCLIEIFFNFVEFPFSSSSALPLSGTFLCFWTKVDGVVGSQLLIGTQVPSFLITWGVFAFL